VGDLVSGGLEIRHPCGGAEVLPQILFYLQRKVCANGMCLRESEDPLKPLRNELKEWYLALEVLVSRMTECLEQGWEKVRVPLQAMSNLQQQSVENPTEIIESISEHLRLNRALRNELIAAYRNDEFGESDSRFGILSAFSRVATHGGVSGAVRRRLERTAERILASADNQCPVCRAFFKNSN
jgi:hypothetical protein